MQRSITAFLVTAVAIWLVGCGNTSASSPVAANLLVTNTFSSIQADGPSVTMTATVENDAVMPDLYWTLTLANVSCIPQCGVIRSFGAHSQYLTYFPPQTAPLNESATITAFRVDDQRQAFVFGFVILPPPTVTITNKFTSIIAGGPSVTLNATVASDPAGAGVTWTLTAGGSSCSPGCGTLNPAPAPSFSATYAPPASIPSGANASPTITATSVTNTSFNDSFSFSFTSSAVLLKGNYAFLLHGYDAGGLPMAIAGTLEADGTGLITGGDLDVNDNGTITTAPSPLSGTYSVDISFSAIPHITATFTNFTFPGGSIHPSIKFFLSADATHGRAIELDGSGFKNSGKILLQDPAILSAGSAAGSYAFGLDSDAPVGSRTVEAGQFVLSDTGVSGGIADESQASAAAPLFSAAPISAGAATKPDASGRGTFTLTANGTATDYAYYVVDGTQLNILEIDNGGALGTVQSGTAEMQKLPFSASTVNAISVFEITGIDTVSAAPNSGPAVSIGQLNLTTSAAAAVTFDANDVGKILTSQQISGTVASFDPVTGRATLTVPGGFASGFLNSAVFYLSDAGKGFLIDADLTTPAAPPPASVSTNYGYSGTLSPQTGAPFTNSSLEGNLVASLGAAAIPSIPDADLALIVDNTGHSYMASGDLASLNTQSGNVPNISFSGSAQLSNANTGHGSLQLPAPFYGDFATRNLFIGSLYLIAPNHFVSIGTSGGFPSAVSYFDPQ